MRHVHRIRLKAFAAAGAIGIAAPEAHAYLDPGTGSMLLQIMLGGLAGLGVAAKLYWHRIRAFLGARDAEDGEREEKGKAERGPEDR